MTSLDADLDCGEERLNAGPPCGPAFCYPPSSMSPIVPARDAAVSSIISEPDPAKRALRLRDLTRSSGAREFHKRRDGMTHAMQGGLWLHRHIWMGRPMVHLVSTDRGRLLEYGRAVGIPEGRLQFKPLKDPETGVRRNAWHWDLGGPVLPPPDETLRDA